MVGNGRLATFKNSTATTTSNFVKQAETIGLMPLGQTNAPEFGFKNITDPRFTGQPAILGTGTFARRFQWRQLPQLSLAGLFLSGASDGGGSIRIPASFSGLIGLKPSRGSMPVGPEGGEAGKVPRLTLR